MFELLHFQVGDLLHPVKVYDMMSYWWYHYRGKWDHLVDTDKKRALELKWRLDMGTKLDWRHPRTFNEKIQWLEAFSDTSLWTKYADKHEVRKYVEACGYQDTLLQEYGLWDSVDDIDFDALPDSFAIKCTHDYASTVLVEDKSKIDKESLVKHLRWRMKLTHGYETVEPHYTKIPHRIIAVELLPHSSKDGEIGAAPIDYKILCIEGKAYLMLICYNRNIQQNKHVCEYYSLDPWEQRLDYLSEKYRHQDFRPIPRPENLNQMIEMAETLSKGFHQVRVDLYNIDGKIYFGELTFTWSCGRIDNQSEELQKSLGEKILLPI